MKTFVVCLILMVCMLSGTVLYINYLTSITDSMNKIVDTIKRSSEKNEWELSMKEAEQLVKLWDKNEKFLSAFTDHGDLDEVKTTIYELQEKVKEKKKDDVLLSVTDLNIFIERLVKNEIPNLENILRHTQGVLKAHSMV